MSYPNKQKFTFDGNAGDYLGVAILAFFVTIITLGIAYPFALVLLERWKADHSMIDGQRLQFTGKAVELFGNWILWSLLTVITFGIYSLWVVPKLQAWKWEHTSFVN